MLTCLNPDKWTFLTFIWIHPLNLSILHIRTGELKCSGTFSTQLQNLYHCKSFRTSEVVEKYPPERWNRSLQKMIWGKIAHAIQYFKPTNSTFSSFLCKFYLVWFTTTSRICSFPGCNHAVMDLSPMAWKIQLQRLLETLFHLPGSPYLELCIFFSKTMQFINIKH